MKKYLSIGIIFILLLSQSIYIGNSKVNAATPEILLKYSAGNTYITKGNPFNITITLVNTTDSELSDVSITIDSSSSSSFYVNGDDPNIDYGNIGKKQQVSKVVQLVYDGGTSKRIPVTIDYNSGKHISATIGLTTYDTTDVSQPVDTTKYKPRLVLTNVPITSGEAGDSVVMKLPVKNSSNYAAKDITVTPVLDNDSDNALVIDDISLSKDIASMQANATETVSFKFKILQNAAAKNYPVKINYEYSNYYGDAFSASTIAYIKVTNGSTSANVSIENVVATPNTVSSGEKTNVGVTIRNSGTLSAKNIKVLLSGMKEDGFITSGSTNTKIIGNLGGGQTTTVNFQLLATSSISTGSYPITAKVTYTDNNDKDNSDEQTFYIGANKTSDNDKVYISKVILSPDTIKAGEKTKAKIFIKNISSQKAKNLKCSVQPNKDDTFGVSGTTNSQFISGINANQEIEVDFLLTSSQKLDNGFYGLTAKMSCEDANGKSIDDDDVFFVNLENQVKDDTGLIIDDVIAPNITLRPNNEFKISFNVINASNISANNIKVTLTPDTGLISKTPTVKVIKSLKANKKQKLSFVFSSPKDAATKSYPIQINADYEIIQNGQKVKQTAKQYISVYIEKPQAGNSSKKTVPKIILDRYNIEPSIVEAGKNFKVNLSFLNTNSFKTVQNIKIYLTTPEGTTTASTADTGNIFTPVNGSNTFYIDSIAPKNRVERQIELYAINDAKPKTYMITANFEYEDTNGTEYKATEFIGIPVRQQAKIETSDISIPSDNPMGTPITLAFDYYNTGKTVLRNLMIKAVGNFDVQGQNSYIGNFDVGSSDHYESTLMPKKEGKLEGFVVISFEDANGQKQEIKKEIASNITKMVPMPTDNANMAQNQDQNSKKSILKSPILWSAVGVAAAGIATFFIIKRKRRKKKLEEMYLDE